MSKQHVNRSSCLTLFRLIRRDYPQDNWVSFVAEGIAKENQNDWALLYERLCDMKYVCYIGAPETLKNWQGVPGALEAHRLQESAKWRLDAPKASKNWRFFWETEETEEDCDQDSLISWLYSSQ